MPTVQEGVDEASPLNAALEAGIESLGRSQTITFRRYVQLVLPLDNFIFWVNADLVATSVLPNLPNTAGPGPNSIDVVGSFHYSTDQRQEEDQTIGVNRVLFATSEEVQAFNDIAPTTIFIATFDDIRFAFSRRGNLFPAAGIYHYQGDAIYPAMETQIVDDLTDFDDMTLVTSNSLPVWLALNSTFQESDITWNLPMYPSFAVPANVVPPYASVHIKPENTTAIQSVPSFNLVGSHFQLCRDMVEITIYGLRNDDALNFQDQLFDYMSDDSAVIGLMNMPVMRDEKRTQAELAILAQKKSFDVEVSYFQSRIADVSRQLILKCIPAFDIMSL